ncbi:MAG: hypothetical protein SV201_14660 [Pseudomonadota bacterium]|nr:hypothetical protein [Pseudomonadota bacterium]
MGVAVYRPLGSRLALFPGLVAVFLELVTHIPYGVPGIAQGVPLHVHQGTDARGDAGLFLCLAAADAVRPGLQVTFDDGGFFAGFEFAFCYRLAVTDRAGGRVVQLVTDGCAATGAESLGDIFRHAAETFFLGDHRVDHVHRLQHVLDHHLGHGIEIRRDLRENDLNAAFSAFVLDGRGDIHFPGQPGGVVDQQVVPLPGRRTDLIHHLLKPGPVLGFAGQHRIRKLGHHGQAAFFGQGGQLAALGVDGYIGSIFRASEIKCGAVVFGHHICRRLCGWGSVL